MVHFKNIENKNFFKDIVVDVNVFNRLRNDEVSLDHLKELVEDECYDFLQNELSKIKNQPSICFKCKLLLSDYQDAIFVLIGST